jgi:hypothetical protein
LQGKAPKKFHAILRETLGERTPSYATIKNWVAQFKRGANIRWKLSRLDFGDQDGIFLIDSLTKGQTIKAECYSSLLVQLQDIFLKKTYAAGRSQRGSC